MFPKFRVLWIHYLREQSRGSTDHLDACDGRWWPKESKHSDGHADNLIRTCSLLSTLSASDFSVLMETILVALIWNTQGRYFLTSEYRHKTWKPKGKKNNLRSPVQMLPPLWAVIDLLAASLPNSVMWQPVTVTQPGHMVEQYLLGHSLYCQHVLLLNDRKKSSCKLSPKYS